MEFRFVLPHGLEQNDWMAFFRAFYRFHTLNRFFSVLLRVACIVLGCLLLFIAGFGASFQFLGIWHAAVFALIGCLCWVMALCYDRINIYFAKKRQLGTGKETVITVDETGITCWIAGITTLYEYAALQSICYARACYLLFLDKEHALVLPERCREGGSSPDLKAFLEEKTGMTLYVID